MKPPTPFFLQCLDTLLIFTVFIHGKKTILSIIQTIFELKKHFKKSNHVWSHCSVQTAFRIFQPFFLQLLTLFYSIVNKIRVCDIWKLIFTNHPNCVRIRVVMSHVGLEEVSFPLFNMSSNTKVLMQPWDVILGNRRQKSILVQLTCTQAHIYFYVVGKLVLASVSSVEVYRSLVFQSRRGVDYWRHRLTTMSRASQFFPSGRHPPANTSTKMISSVLFCFFHWDLRTWIQVLSLLKKWTFTARWWGNCVSLQSWIFLESTSPCLQCDNEHTFRFSPPAIHVNNACSITMFFNICCNRCLCCPAVMFCH